ncbi:MAG TPA: pseudouridine synthase [Polyangiaceae bacterium]
MTKSQDTTAVPKGERLQKILSRAGVASRRAAEAMIQEGRVRVNGRVVTELGTRADPKRDRIELDGDRLTAERHVYIVIHKPRGVVATLKDPEGRPSVGDMLATLGVRAFPIGRLDFATSGVLLATNDGDFANALLHPRGGVPKRYVVKLAGKMDEDDLERWRKGVKLEDGGVTLPADVDLLRYEGDKTWIELTIREGRNQQIRRMGEATRFPVMRLARTSFAGVTSEGLPPGRWRYLTRQELMLIKKTYGVPKKIPHDLPEGGGDSSGGNTRREKSKAGGVQGQGARYGLGAPGRRDPETSEDYGGRARRGESQQGDARSAPQNRGGRDERRGRANMPMRTTGKNTYSRH